MLFVSKHSLILPLGRSVLIDILRSLLNSKFESKSIKKRSVGLQSTPLPEIMATKYNIIEPTG